MARFEPSGEAQEQGAYCARKGTTTLPCRLRDSGLSGFAGRVRFRRRFGWPGRLDEHERVWLTFAGATGRAEVSVNGHQIGVHDECSAAFEFEITQFLAARNELTVVLAAGEDGGLWGEVALEVRCIAFLRDVQFATVSNGDKARFRAQGLLVGPAGMPLELYLLVDNATAAYATVEGDPEGREFEIASEPMPRSAAEHRPAVPVRLELMRGGVAWYIAERQSSDTAD